MVLSLKDCPPATPIPSGGVLDPLIDPYVRAMQEAGFDTFESCQGGEGHGWSTPRIYFWGDENEGHRAVVLALKRDWPVGMLVREWSLLDINYTSRPMWCLRFFPFKVDESTLSVDD